MDPLFVLFQLVFPFHFIKYIKNIYNRFPVISNPLCNTRFNRIYIDSLFKKILSVKIEKKVPFARKIFVWDHFELGARHWMTSFSLETKLANQRSRSIIYPIKTRLSTKLDRLVLSAMTFNNIFVVWESNYKDVKQILFERKTI